MALRECYIGGVGPLYYDDNEQSKAIVDDGDVYASDSALSIDQSEQTETVVTGISVTTTTKTVVTSVDFVAETTTTEDITYVTDVSTTTATITYVSDVNLNK